MLETVYGTHARAIDGEVLDRGINAKIPVHIPPSRGCIELLEPALNSSSRPHGGIRLAGTGIENIPDIPFICKEIVTLTPAIASRLLAPSDTLREFDGSGALRSSFRSTSTQIQWPPATSSTIFLPASKTQ